MQLGFFTMPIHPLGKDWRVSLKEDREAFILADELGYVEGYVGEHTTDAAENITSCISFLAWIANDIKRMRLGTGTVNMPNAHPAAVAAQIAMLDHMLDGRFNFGISPGGLMSDAEVFGNLEADRNAMFREAIATGVERGEFVVPDVLVAAFAIINMGIRIAEWFSPDGRLSSEDVADAHAELALRMAGAVRRPHR